MDTLKISARNAGAVELEDYCPRCMWYLLRIKRWPFQLSMPGLMFYMERIEKAFIMELLSKGRLPEYFGPFADCTEPVEFPFSMSQLHKETGVELTARVDMLLRKRDGNLCLLDLKTSKIDGGGQAFLPQYEIQVIGYSWVTEAASVGKVDTAGLLYCDVDVNAFDDDPLSFRTGMGLEVPFELKPHEVHLDYERLTCCLNEATRVWELPRPPHGRGRCEDCALLSKFLKFEADLEYVDQIALTFFPELQRYAILNQYRDLERRLVQDSKQGGEECTLPDEADGMWAAWEFD